jgi:hypothetical protein
MNTCAYILVFAAGMYRASLRAGRTGGPART